jgi:hypothetical protein
LRAPDGAVLRSKTAIIPGLDLLADGYYVVAPPSVHADGTQYQWLGHAWTLSAFDLTPTLLIYSPTKRCGKSRVLELLAVLVPKPLPAVHLTPATIYRSIEQWRPTLMVDEVDFDKNSDLVIILNSSYRRTSSAVPRCVGSDFVVRLFSTWCAKVVASNKILPETLIDRSIVVKIHRKRLDEYVAPLKVTELSRSLYPLKRRLARWKRYTPALSVGTDKPMSRDIATQLRV